MSFESDIKRFTSKVERAADKVFRGTALDIFSQVMQRTPVDTGRLRGNWQTGIGMYSKAELARIGGRASMSEANRKIAKWDIERPIYFVNNLPYAQVVEYGLYNHRTDKTTSAGYSSQAPRGMVRVTVAEFDRIMQANAYKARR